MQTESEPSLLAPTKERVITIFRVVGWLTFWVELGLSVTSGLALLFAISGRNFTTEANAGLGIGIFWAVGGILVLLLCF